MLLRRQLLAVFLLLCFVRVLLPEAWVLALHAHEHTTELRRPAGRQQPEALIEKQHTHCHVVQFYNVPFQLVPPLQLPVAPVRALFKPMAILALRAGVAAEPSGAYLRGPPARS